MYYEESGEIWVSGLFVLKSTGEPVQVDGLAYEFFDGEVIGVENDRLLVPK